MPHEQSKEQKFRQQEEQAAIKLAQLQGKPHTFIAKDGCEVTVTPQGHVFYNVADWW